MRRTPVVLAGVRARMVGYVILVLWAAMSLCVPSASAIVAADDPHDALMLVSSNVASVAQWMSLLDKQTKSPIPDVPITSHIPDQPYFVFVANSSTRKSLGSWSLGYRFEQQTTVSGNADALRLFQVLNGSDIPLKHRTLRPRFELSQGRFQALDLTYRWGKARSDHVDHGWNKARSDHVDHGWTIARSDQPDERWKGWSGWFTGSVALPEGMYHYVGAGWGEIHQDDLSFFLQYVTATKDKGLGWMLGGGVTYETDRFSLTVSGKDVLGQFIWPRSRVRRAVINSNTVVIGPDGEPVHVGSGSGTHGFETWWTRPLIQWDVAYTSFGSTNLSRQPQWGLKISGVQDRSFRLLASRHLTAHTRVDLGVLWPQPTVVVGLSYHGLSAALGIDRLPLQDAQTVFVSLSSTLRF